MEPNNKDTTNTTDSTPVIPKEGPSNILPKAFGVASDGDMIKGFEDEVSEKLGDTQPKAFVDTLKPLPDQADNTVSTITTDNAVQDISGKQPPLDPPTPTLDEVLHQQPKKRSIFKIIFLVLFVLILSLFIGGSVTLALVANNVLKLENTQLKFLANHVYYKVPFVPKTAEHVMQTVFYNHYNAKSVEFSANLLPDTSSFSESTGITGALGVKGYVSGSEDNLAMDVNISYPEVVSVDLLRVSGETYFSFDKFPSFVTTFLLGTDTDSAMFENIWVRLESANNRTNTLKLDNTSALYEAFNKIIVPNLVLTSDLYKDVPVYKVTTTLTPEILNSFFETYAQVADISTDVKKPSISFSSLDLALYIDKKSSYITHIDTKTTYADTTLIPLVGTIAPLPQDDIDIILDISIDIASVGVLKEVVPPQDVLSMEDYISLIFNQLIEESTTDDETGDFDVSIDFPLTEDDVQDIEGIEESDSPFGELIN